MAEKLRSGVIERSANFLKKLHYGLGAVALAGAEVVAPAAAVLVPFATWEGAHGLFWQWVEKRSAKKANSKENRRQ